MEEIQVGEYCRTYEGYIGILKEINKKNYNYLTIDAQNEVRKDSLEPLNYIYLKNENIKKHSKNIIDLVEVGDIVYTYDVLNYDVIYIYDNEMLQAVKQDIEQGIKIKTIWTKEQLKSIEYNI